MSPANDAGGEVDMNANTFRTLRIIFCLLAVAFCATAIFIFVYFGWWGMACVLGAIVCGLLMVFCKRRQEALENKDKPAAHGDFITGPLKEGEESGRDD